MLSIPSHLNRCLKWRNPECRLGGRPCRTEALRALGALRPASAHPAPGRGQQESYVQGKSIWRERRQISKLWKYIPNIRNPLLEQRTRLQSPAEQKMGGTLFYFWILPNQKNLRNCGNCLVEMQTLPGWCRPVYK